MNESPSGLDAERCNVCDSALVTRFPHVQDPQSREMFSISSCTRCGLGHTWPRPSDLQHYYGPAYHGGRHGFTATYCAWRRMRFVRSVCGRGRLRLLDVGCGDGTFMLACEQAGHEVFGTEMNPERARANGLRVEENIGAIVGQAPFDCITLWHSLEHMRDPRSVIRQAVKTLAPGGILLVAVPDAEGAQARAFGPHWFHLDVPRHLYHFGLRSLSLLFQEQGLEVVRSWHHEVELDLFGWVQSSLNRLLPNPNVFFYELTGRHTGLGALEVGASYVLGSMLSGLAAPLTATGPLLGSGGTLVLAGRRSR